MKLTTDGAASGCWIDADDIKDNIPEDFTDYVEEGVAGFG